MDNVKTLLNEEIEAQLRCLSSLPDGSEEKTKAVDALNKLYRLRIDETKVETDYEMSRKQLASEEYVALEEKESRKWIEWVRTGIEGLSIVAPLVFYGIWMNRGLEFEKEGTFTSKTFGGLTKFFRPRR